MSRSVQPKANVDLHDIWQAETRSLANQALGRRIASWRGTPHSLEKYKYEAAC
jgi:hypothetical protein